MVDGDRKFINLWKCTKRMFKTLNLSTLILRRKQAAILRKVATKQNLSKVTMLPILIISQRKKELLHKVSKLDRRRHKLTNRLQEHNQLIKNQKKRFQMLMKLCLKQKLQKQASLSTLNRSQSRLLCNLTQKDKQEHLTA